MQPYALFTSLDIPTVERALQDRETIRAFIKALPNTPPEGVGSENPHIKFQPNQPPRLWTCHGLARGILKALGPQLQLPWQIIDGLYYDNDPHSWLECYLNGEFLIMDVYPIGALDQGPHLWDGHGMCPANRIFRTNRVLMTGPEAEAAAIAQFHATQPDI